MHIIASRIVIAAAFAAATASPALATPVTLPPSSFADGLSASFTAGGTTTAIPPVGLASGTGPGLYNKIVNAPLFSEQLGIADGAQEIATLTVTAAGIHSHAVYPGIGIDFVSVEGDGTVGSVNATLQNYPPPPGVTIFPPPLLSVAAGAVADSSSASLLVPSNYTVTGTTKINTLTITGRLVGGQTLTFTGTPAPNTVLFSSPTVTITLNAQNTTASIHCIPNPPLCILTPTGITTRGIDVTLTKADIGGHLVTGDIVIGESNAANP